VDCSHGKRLWEGGDHSNLECFPVFIRHLKKFLSAMKKLPAENGASTETEKSPAGSKTPSDNVALPGAPQLISQRIGTSRKTTEHVDKHRRSTGYREKARTGAGKRERSRRSVDWTGRIKEEDEQLEKPRKSFDRLVFSLSAP
jgi:abhydrolase domain-containing protein 17